MKERPTDGWWIIPPEMYKKFDKEFHFDFDPCPNPRPEGFDGLTCDWKKSNWVNPPFWAGITGWVRKAIAEQEKGKNSVLILPLDNWVRLLIEAGAEIRSLGSHEWIHTSDDSRRKAPRPSFLFILKGTHKPDSQNKDVCECGHEKSCHLFEIHPKGICNMWKCSCKKFKLRKPKLRSKK